MVRERRQARMLLLRHLPGLWTPACSRLQHLQHKTNFGLRTSHFALRTSHLASATGRALLVTHDSTPIVQTDTQTAYTAARAVARAAERGALSPTTQIWRQRMVAGTLALSMWGGIVAGAPAASAQDGTGASTAILPVTCVIPTATQGQDSAPVTPIVRIRTPVVERSTPVVQASPASAATPIATSGNDETALNDDLNASASAVLTCLSDGNVKDLVKFTSDTYRGQLIGSDQPISSADYAALAPSLPVLPYTLIDVSDVAGSRTKASATVTYTVGKQVRTATWAFSRGDVAGKSTWILESETPGTVRATADATKVDVTIENDAFSLSIKTIASKDVLFTIMNDDAEDHEMFVIQLASGTKSDALLTNIGGGLPKGVTFVGQVTVPAGGDGQLLLTGLAKGSYTVVDLFPDKDGLPHLSNGMETTFTVG